MENKNSNSAISYQIADDGIVYLSNFLKIFEENSEEEQQKKLREKFITSEEDDALSENRTEDQEEQNDIHNNLFDNQPKRKNSDIKPPKL